MNKFLDIWRADLSSAARMTTWAMLVLLLSGCGQDANVPVPASLVPLQGRVIDGGEPVPNTIMVFRPRAENGSQARGLTNRDGRYQVLHESDQPGIEAGVYDVSIRRFDRFFAKSATGKRRDPSAAYAESARAFVVTVPEQGGRLDFELGEGAAPAQAVPVRSDLTVGGPGDGE